MIAFKAWFLFGLGASAAFLPPRQAVPALDEVKAVSATIAATTREITDTDTQSSAAIAVLFTGRAIRNLNERIAQGARTISSTGALTANNAQAILSFLRTPFTNNATSFIQQLENRRARFTTAGGGDLISRQLQNTTQQITFFVGNLTTKAPSNLQSAYTSVRNDLASRLQKESALYQG